MNIVLSSLMHGRHDTVNHCIAKNIVAGIENFVFSYTLPEDGDLLRRKGIKTIQAHNFIPSKAQASLFACYDLNPDAVMLMGSDDYINEKALVLITQLLERYDYISFYDCLFLDKGKYYRWPGYPKTSARHGEPCGAGKVIRRDLLDKLNWEVFTGGNDRGADFHAHSNIKRASKKRAYIGTKEGAILVDVKDKGSSTPVNLFNYLEPYQYE